MMKWEELKLKNTGLCNAHDRVPETHDRVLCDTGRVLFSDLQGHDHCIEAHDRVPINLPRDLIFHLSLIPLASFWTKQLFSSLN